MSAVGERVLTTRQVTSSDQITQAALAAEDISGAWDNEPYRYRIESRHKDGSCPETVGVFRTREEAENDRDFLWANLSRFTFTILPLDPPLMPTPPCRVKALMALLKFSLDVHEFVERVPSGELIAADIEMLQELIDDLKAVVHRIPTETLVS